MNRDAALLMRTLDHDLGDAGLALLLHDEAADSAIFVKKLGVFLTRGEPAAVPRSVDANAQACRMYFMTHYAVSFAGSADASAAPLALDLPRPAFADFFFAFLAAFSSSSV